MGPFALIQKGLAISTQGLRWRGLRELRVQVNAPILLADAEELVSFLGDYLLREQTQLNPGETLNYGYWLIKFQAADDQFLDVWEYNPDATEFVPGASLTLHYWREQHRICSLYGSAFMPPRPDTLTAVSSGVLEGLPVQAVRYPWREHMSGWLMVTRLWAGTVQSLVHQHTYHVTAARPDLAPLVALQVGFRFDLTNEERAWLDFEVFEQRPL
jgi:hypothetical protein